MGKTIKDLKKEHPELSKLDIESFSKIMDTFLTDVDYTMVLHMPEGTQDVEIKDNVDAGPVIWLYALTAGMVPVLRCLIGTMIDANKAGDMIDSILGMVRQDVLEGIKQKGGE